MLRFRAVCFCLAVLTTSLATLPARPALAQGDPELGDTDVDDEGAQTEAPPAEPKGNSASWGADTGFNEDTENANDEDDAPRGDTDHASVVGSLGLGIFGLADLPLPLLTNGKFGPSLTAPVLGARYWFSDSLGVDIGLSFIRRSRTDAAFKLPTDTTPTGEASSKAYALGIMVGLPIGFAPGKHYVLLVTPHVGIGRTKATDGAVFEGEGDDVFLSAFTLELGVKAGVEVQLGGIGLPQLGLQFNAGFRFRASFMETNAPGPVDMAGNPTDIITENSESVVEFTPGGTLGQLVSGMIAAIYYF